MHFGAKRIAKRKPEKAPGRQSSVKSDATSATSTSPTGNPSPRAAILPPLEETGIVEVISVSTHGGKSEELLKRLEAWFESIDSAQASLKLEPTSEILDELKKEINQLKDIEEKYNKLLLLEKTEETDKALVKKLLDTEFFKQAQEVVEALRPSSGYLVEVQMDRETKRLIGAKIKIRTTSKQYRHITPIALVERIFKNALKPDTELEQTIITLLSKIEIFKRNFTKEDNDLIQALFDYYKNKIFFDINGIAKLIKITAHLYNNNSSLALSNEGVKTPYTYNCYLVPTLKFGGQLYKHEGEGPFIKAQLKILDGYEIQLGNNSTTDKKLSNQEIKQIAYIIFALFDFIPLPSNTSIPKKMIKSPKTRYIGEGIERLYQVAATHLLYVFEAYPKLRDYCQAIISYFSTYVAQGVSINELGEILSENKKALAVLEKEGVDTFTSGKQGKGAVRGFCGQYEEKPIAFKKKLEKATTEALAKYDDLYFQVVKEKEIEVENIKESTEYKKQYKKQQLIEKIIINATEIIIHAFFVTSDFSFLKRSELLVLRISQSELTETFKKNLIDYLYSAHAGPGEERRILRRPEAGNEKLLSFLKKIKKKQFIENFDDMLTRLQETIDKDSFINIISQDIHKTYLELGSFHSLDDSKSNLKEWFQESKEVLDAIKERRFAADTSLSKSHLPNDSSRDESFRLDTSVDLTDISVELSELSITIEEEDENISSPAPTLGKRIKDN